MNNEFTEWSQSLAEQAQKEVQQEIAMHKLNGQPIFYEEDNMLIMENPDGKRFEYRLEDGKVQIIRELDK
ncbi:MmgE/PrpD family protein [Mastigocoleus sp. MO_188.B34]|uniref:MmgE/PrpD family protein n=1 Tax=Mastigocoleus sp. MO_188.B34 TaxID=3036635 RepID=UPI00260E217D|nr:MmgE/PrpD family protein [Mastigocoleus sp. MO_188.B34]MDJ0696925.1 MmgE/PrpD family protein [Mastigocoleus sp. MO_188.B34]